MFVLIERLTRTTGIQYDWDDGMLFTQSTSSHVSSYSRAISAGLPLTFICIEDRDDSCVFVVCCCMLPLQCTARYDTDTKRICNTKCCAAEIFGGSPEQLKWRESAYAFMRVGKKIIFLSK